MREGIGLSYLDSTIEPLSVQLPLLILVSGGSCAGKSTFSSELKRAVQSEGGRVEALSTDLFYRDLPEGVSTRDFDFDSEQNVDRAALFELCSSFSEGYGPATLFDFCTHSRSKVVELPALEVLILEGIFTFSFEELLSLPALRLYIDTDQAERYRRRSKIYSERLGHSRELIDHKFFGQAEPYHHTRIEPRKALADLIIRGDASYGSIIERVVMLVRSHKMTAENTCRSDL
jgi:uridine kinase